MDKHKTFRQGQILKLISGEAIASQDELRKRLVHMKLRVTQATLSRDIAELKLVKTAAGYKPLAACRRGSWRRRCRRWRARCGRICWTCARPTTCWC